MLLYGMSGMRGQLGAGGGALVTMYSPHLDICADGLCGLMKSV